MKLEDESESHGRAIARVDPRWDVARTEQALAELHRRRARRRTTSVVVALAASVALALVGWTVSRTGTGVAPSPIAPPSSVDRVVHLADGSRVTPDEGAAVVVEHVSDDRIGVRIDRGAASLEVVPGLSRLFEVRAGDVTVRVIGTAFRVEMRDEGRVHVSVARGHVEVSWPAGHADLIAGEEGLFPRPELSAQALLDPPTTSATVSLEPQPRETHPREVPAAPVRDSWQTLARASRYDEAYAALGAPTERAANVGDDVEDLLLAADVARLSGHPAEALPLLGAVARDHARDPRAVLATFTRGRLLVELGRPAEGADELERALASEPSGSLAEDALARAALAEAAAGDQAQAATLADRYLLAHPDGRWASRVRAIASGASHR